jgi:hypothetical protein
MQRKQFERKRGIISQAIRRVVFKDDVLNAGEASRRIKNRCKRRWSRYDTRLSLKVRLGMPEKHSTVN